MAEEAPQAPPEPQPEPQPAPPAEPERPAQGKAITGVQPETADDIPEGGR